MANSPHRRWKGCCIMCGFRTLRGAGEARKLRFSELRKLGTKRRLDKAYRGD